ncbi:MAG TPA: helix-turn-helix transcriptional regulator [Flavobacterium sp.]|jgi:putative transcriptional regulator
MKNNLRILRATAKVSQADLAQKISVSRQTINAIETGKYVPSTVLALRLAKVFNATVEEIFQLEQDDLIVDNS